MLVDDLFGTLAPASEASVLLGAGRPGEYERACHMRRRKERTSLGVAQDFNTCCLFLELKMLDLTSHSDSSCPAGFRPQPKALSPKPSLQRCARSSTSRSSHACWTGRQGAMCLPGSWTTCQKHMPAAHATSPWSKYPKGTSPIVS